MKRHTTSSKESNRVQKLESDDDGSYYRDIYLNDGKADCSKM